MGTLIHIEGMDGVGKTTQTELLKESIQRMIESNNLDIPFVSQHFPIYENPSSLLVREYLKGTFGSAMDIDPYTASIIYSADRALSYEANADWAKCYKEGGIVLCDRYTDSNVSLQASKLFDKENFPNYTEIAKDSKFRNYVDWLYTLEYYKLGIPKPNLVIYLTMNPSLNAKLLDGRNQAKDIHEQDKDIQKNGATIISALKEKWENDKDYYHQTDVFFEVPHIFIECDDNNGNILPIEVIHRKIISTINEVSGFGTEV